MSFLFGGMAKSDNRGFKFLSLVPCFLLAYVGDEPTQQPYVVIPQGQLWPWGCGYSRKQESMLIQVLYMPFTKQNTGSLI